MLEILTQNKKYCNQNDFWGSMSPGLIEGECMENILPSSRCFADVTTQMRCAVLTIPHDSPRSPFSISPQ